MHTRLEKLLFKVGHFALVKLGVPTWRTEQTLKGLWYRLRLAVHDNIVIDRWKPTYFLYADESENKEMNISSLTGIYFPEKKLFAIRTAMYAILRKVNDKLEKGNYEAAVELHGSALLSAKDYPNIDDEFRFEVYSQMVDTINKYKVLVFRLGLIFREEYRAPNKRNEYQTL